MTIRQRITGLDWYVWFYYLADACIKGAALGVKASGAVGVASLSVSEQWSPSAIDPKILLWTAFYGFIYAFVDYVGKGLPTGKEADDEPTTIPSP